ncbi:unnamed protein product [Ranitomeya imitator]|uniref:Ubinuclein middle domain-containing protein n=1 Tax=Ranitomeya imitator TaxID=111125 RepID=A0ABN9L2X1_9NEOB|nr:unnamed protein product [Ranitomeya imitator]
MAARSAQELRTSEESCEVETDYESEGSLNFDKPGFQESVDSLIEAVNQSLGIEDELVSSSDHKVSFKRSKQAHRVFSSHPEFEDLIRRNREHPDKRFSGQRALKARVFTKVMSTVVSILHSRGIVVLPYLDDLLIKGPTFQSCKENVDITLDTLSRLGWHQADDDRDRNPSEDEDEEKPGKRVMGPRKKFYWDDTIRNLLCNLVKIKLGCYELEPNKSQTAEDYLKNFMETEVKPLWPKGWMQSRLLFKESRSVHNHLTSAPAKKKVILVPKPKVKESSPKKEQKVSTPLSTVGRAPSLNATPIGGLASSTCSETICLDDSLDEQLSFKTPSLDSISEALAVLNNGSGPSSSSHTETPTSRPKVALREEKLASIMSKLPLGGPKKVDTPHHTTSLIAGHSAPVPKKPQDHATAHSTMVSGLIAGSSIQNPKVSLEPLPAKLLQQGLQRSLQAEVSSSSTPAKMKASSASQLKAACASSTSPSSTSVPLTSSSHAQVSSSSSQVQNSSLQTVKLNPPIQQNYVTPLQATISKSHTNPVVRLTSSPQISSTSPIIKTSEKKQLVIGHLLHHLQAAVSIHLYLEQLPLLPLVT